MSYTRRIFLHICSFLVLIGKGFFDGEYDCICQHYERIFQFKFKPISDEILRGEIQTQGLQNSPTSFVT